MREMLTLLHDPRSFCSEDQLIYAIYGKGGLTPGLIAFISANDVSLWSRTHIIDFVAAVYS